MTQNVRINFALNSGAAVKGVDNLAKAFQRLNKSGGKLKLTQTSKSFQMMGKRAKESRDRTRMLNEQFGIFAKTNEKVASKTKRTAASISRVNTQLKASATSSKIAAGGFKALATSVIGMVGAYAGFRAVAGTVSNVADFSKSLAEVQTIANETPEQLGKIRGEILKLSAATGKRPADLSRAFYQIQSAGITDSAAAANVLDASTKLAVGGLADLESTINAVTKVLAVYQGEFKDASEITDILFKSVKLGQVKVEELAMGLPQVISLGKSLGLSFSEVAGASAAMSKRAGTAALGFTQLRSIFSGVIRGQSRAKALLGDNAEAFSLQALKAKGLSKFLADVTKAAGGNQQVLFKLFGRVEALTGVTAGASDNFKDMGRIIKETAKTSGESGKAFEEIADSVGGMLDKIKAKAEVLQLVVGISGEDVLIGVLKRIDESMETLLFNFQTMMRFIKSTLITVGILAFSKFGIRAVSALMAVRAEFVLLRAQSATALTGMRVGMFGFIKATKLARIAVKGFKVAITFGLSLALDAFIFKVLEMKEQFGSWRAVFRVFQFHAEIAFKKVELFADEFVLKFWEMRKAVADFINKGIVKLGSAMGKLFGVDIQVKTVQAFNGEIKKSKENIRGTTEEVVALEKRLDKFKLKNTQTDEGLLGGLGKKTAPLEGVGGKGGEVANVPSTEAVADKLKSVRDQILLFNEETRLLINERERLASDENFVFLQEQLGTEKAFKTVARKEAMKNLKMGKKAELEFEKKISEEKRKQALTDLKFTEMTNQEKLKATQNTLQLMLGLTKAAGTKFFGIGKAVAMSESVVSGILAVQKALASAPYPLNIVNASIIGATAALNTAKIASSKPPSFRTGGFVPGTPTGGRDSVLANLEPREAVVTQSQQRNFLRLANGEGGDDNRVVTALMELKNAILSNPTSIEIDGRQVALAMRDQRLSGVAI